MRLSTRIVISALMVMAALACGGCATANSGGTTKATDEYSNVETATITTRTVTLPKAYFSDDKTAEENIAALEAGGATDVHANEDGSYTMTMDIAKYNEIVDSTKTQVAKTLDSLAGSADYPNITNVTYDDQFSHVQVTLNSDEVGLVEVFVPYAAGMPACMYQQLAGQPVKCTIDLVGASGSVLDTLVLPDDLAKSTGAAS